MSGVDHGVAAPIDPAVDENGRAVEMQLSTDLGRRGLMAAPVLCLIAGWIWGLDGLASAGFGLGLVIANFLLAAVIVSNAAKISVPLVMAGAMGGFLIRLGIIMVAVILVRDQSWISLPALGATIIVSHLGLLLWELKYVAISMAHAGVKPQQP